MLFSFASAILVFLSRLTGNSMLGHRIGFFELALASPLIYLLITAPILNRPWLYYMQAGLMLAWILVEWVLDYILKTDFRKNRWAVIGYVTLFFAGTGGMLGVAANAGPQWLTAAGPLFIAMAFLAFLQRTVTGL